MSRTKVFPYLLTATCASGLMLVLAGCFSMPSGLPMVRGEEQDDIPVPKHFEFDDSSRPDLDTLEDFRSYTAYYKGSGKFADLAPWYIAEMANHGWTFKRMEGVDDEDRQLRFEKKDEYSTIRIYKEIDVDKGAFTNVVKVQIRPLGTEDLTVEESLGIRGSRLRPAAYKEEPAQPDRLETQAEGVGENQIKQPRTSAGETKSPKRSSDILGEIEAFENS